MKKPRHRLSAEARETMAWIEQDRVRRLAEPVRCAYPYCTNPNGPWFVRRQRHQRFCSVECRQKNLRD